MNEIEKMYKNAGVKKQKYFSHASFYDGSDVFEEKIPPFTAEKQIELIKWLIQKNFYDERIIKSNFEKFEEALANVFNYFWQDLTKEERKQIKEILQ